MHAMSSRVACALRSAIARHAVRTSPSRFCSTSASRTAGISLSSLSRYLCARTTLAQSKHGAHIRFHSSNSGREPSEGGTVVHSFADPDRPDLFYHLFAAPTSISSSTPVFALSFLSEPPPSVVSAAVIGWLPASGEGEQAGLNDFVENERFREALHEAVQSALRDGVDEVQKNGAIQLREGWMHIHDNRNIPALGRIGEPDDIIGSVRVENGEVSSFPGISSLFRGQPMPSYRLCTADGVLQLTEGLAQRLVEVLQAKVREEQQ